MLAGKCCFGEEGVDGRGAVGAGRGLWKVWRVWRDWDWDWDWD